MPLTDEQVAWEVEQINTLDNWPLFPVLPMKNLYRKYDDDTRLGVMLADNQTVVYILSLFDVGKAGALKNAPREEFESTEALVRAGWVGD